MRYKILSIHLFYILILCFLILYFLGVISYSEHFMGTIGILVGMIVYKLAVDEEDNNG